jgi:hypothetical protein
MLLINIQPEHSNNDIMGIDGLITSQEDGCEICRKIMDCSFILVDTYIIIILHIICSYSFTLSSLQLAPARQQPHRIPSLVIADQSNHHSVIVSLGAFQTLPSMIMYERDDGLYCENVRLQEKAEKVQSPPYLCLS